MEINVQKKQKFNSDNSKSITFWLEKPVALRVKSICSDMDITMSALFRELVISWIEDVESKKVV
jgi:hypothetical protein